MPLAKYIKQPLSQSLSQYTDAELRKVESAISNIAVAGDELVVITDALTAADVALDARIDVLEAQAFTAIAIKPTDQSLANDNSLNADGDLHISLGVGIWEIQCTAVAFCTATSVNIRAVIDSSGTIEAPETNFVPGFNAGNFGLQIYDTVVPHTTTNNIGTLVANLQKSYEWTGVVKVLTAGVFTFWWAQGTSSATAIILRAGSFLRARKLI
jgi:hypothetical protein